MVNDLKSNLQQIMQTWCDMLWIRRSELFVAVDTDRGTGNAFDGVHKL